MSTLRDYLLQKRDAFHALQARPDDQVKPLDLRAQTTAEGRSGVRRIRIRDFQLLSDSPPDFAGYNLGPSSPELQLGVLSSCLTHIFLIQAADRNVPLDSLEVTISAQSGVAGAPTGEVPAPRYPQNIRYEVRLDTPASDEEIQSLQEAVERVCPIYNLLKVPQIITGKVNLTPSADDTDPGGLRAYLIEKRAALLRRRERAAQGDTPPQTLQAVARAEGRSGVRRVRIRDFQVISDSPPDFAGYNLGPSSPETQLGVLSSCLTHVFLIEAASRQVPLDALEVVVTAHQEPRAGKPGFEQTPRYPYDIQYEVNLISPAGAEEIEALHTAVKAICPIFNLLSQSQTVTGSVERVTASVH